MTTGITMPAWFLVAALNSLQNAMMLTPCWPKAGPTGGAGLACPPGICNLMLPIIFLAIRLQDFRINEDLDQTSSTPGSFRLFRPANIPVPQAYFARRCL